MKHKLTKHELLGSLAFPIGIIIWMAYEYISGSIMLGGLEVHFLHRWSYIIAFAVCGVLPLLLTLIMRIDTSEQFLPRLVISLCTLAAVSIVKEFLGVGMVVNGYILPLEGIILIISLVISEVFFHVKRPVKLSAWLIIFIGNPCLARLICYVMTMNYLKDIVMEINVNNF